MSEMISREAAVAICDKAALKFLLANSARYEVVRARDTIRALPAVQPDAAAIREEQPDSLDRVARAICLASFGDTNPVPVPDELMPRAWELIRDRYLILAEAAIRALNTGKEVMPDEAGSARGSSDIGPGDQAVAGAAKFALDRIREWESDNLTDGTERDWHGHVGPALARLASTLAAQPEAVAGAAQCCMCGKKGLSTEEDGGPECELSDGRWVCSSDCYDVALGIMLKPVAGGAPVTVQEAARVLLIAESLEAWAQCARDCRHITPSIVGLMDMALTLRALAQKGDSHE